MADTKVTQLATVTVNGTDLLYLVDDVAGTPTSGKATVTALGNALVSELNILTDSSGTALNTKASPTESDSFLIFDAAASDAPVTSTGAQVKTGLKLVESDTTGITGADQITNIVSLTQAEYDALTPDAATLYVIVG